MDISVVPNLFSFFLFLDRIIAHFAFNASLVSLSPAFNNSFIKYFVKSILMKHFQTPRGEKNATPAAFDVQRGHCGQKTVHRDLYLL